MRRMKEHSLRPVVAVLMTPGLAAVAQAQTTNPAPPSVASTNSATELPDVVVKGEQEPGYNPEELASPKFTEPLRDIPQTITVIPRAVFEEQGATSLRDVLRNVSGISIQAGEGGTPAGDQLSIRGYSARTDLFIDGVRDFGGYSRDPFNFEQVEVAKGPASSVSGRGSTGGSINMVSKTPKANPFIGGSLGGGTDEYRRATLDVNQPLTALGLETAAVRLNGLWHENDTPGRDVAEDSRWGIAPSIAFGLGKPTQLTLSYFHLNQDNTPDYGIPWVPANTGPLAAYSEQPAPVDYSNFYGLKARDYEKVRTDLATAELKHAFSDSLRIRNLTRYGETDRDSIITAPRFADVNTSTDIRRNDWKSRDQTDEIFANQTDLNWDFNTGPVEHSLVGGVEYDHETEVNHTRVATGPNSPNTDLYNPNPDDPYTENIQRNGARAESTADTVSLYAFDTLKLSEKWELNGGLRWDHFDLDYTSVATNGAATTLSRSDEMLSWRGGLVFKPRANGSLYFGYGTSFNPAAEGLTLSTGATAAANLNADPEESRTFELGTKWDLLDERLSLSAAVFRTEKTNARTQDPADPSDVIVLQGEQVVQGIELGAAGRITKDWQVFAGYTFLHSEITESLDPAEIGNELSNTPEHSFSLWTTYQLPDGILLGGGAQYVGSRFSNNANTREAPDYVVFDAMAAYEVNKHLTLRLNVYNLANEEYIGSVGGGHFIPGNGRSAVLSANFSF
jgi:catecholate siderophore receptor